MASAGYLDQQGLPLRVACPACPGSVPMKNAANGLTCPRCRGRVLDRTDAAGILRRLPQVPLPQPNAAARRALCCPLCRSPMDSHVAAGVQVEFCRTCQAAFFEFQAHRQIAMAAARAQPAPAPQAACAAAAQPMAVPRPAYGGSLAEPLPTPPGAARRLLRLLPLLALGVIGWRNAGPVGRLAAAAVSSPAAVVTTMDMGTARNALAAEYALSERLPGSLEAFLRSHLSTVDPHLDRWGTPYELRGEGKAAALASCGPDRTCQTDDDLSIRIFPESKPGERDEAIERIERVLAE